MFKQRVRSCYGLTAEQSIKIFRGIKWKSEETYSQLGCRLDGALSRWVEESKVDTFEALKNLIGLKQFYNQVPSQCRWILRDKKVKSVEEAAVILDEIEVDLGRNMWMVPEKKSRIWDV